MRILAINCGSSSLKCALVDDRTGARPVELRIAIASPDGAMAGVDEMLETLRARWPEFGELDAVAHRVVHGGERFTGPAIVDADVLSELDAQARLAPLHNPPAIHAIRGARGLFPHVPHVAVFDTAFHATLPPAAREYALPADIRARFGIRRFGFHGISHGGVAARVGALLKRDPRELRVISCHLGSGASVTAIDRGRSVDTSMGMTPLEGLVMGTRAGDLDPGVVLELSRRMPPGVLEELLTAQSGLRGLTGT